MGEVGFNLLPSVDATNFMGDRVAEPVEAAGPGSVLFGFRGGLCLLC